MIQRLSPVFSRLILLFNLLMKLLIEFTHLPTLPTRIFVLTLWFTT